MRKYIGLMGVLVLFAATADVTHAKKGKHPAATQTTAPQGGTAPADPASASQAATPQGGVSAPGTAGASQAATPQGGVVMPPAGMGGGAPQGLMAPGGAPVGHRQPTAADVPPQERNPNDPMTKEDEALDKKIKSICKGC